MKKLLVILAILTLVGAGSAHAYWTGIAANVYTDYTIQYTGHSGSFWYNGVQTATVALATFDLSIDQGNYPGTQWLTNHRWYCADLHEYIAPSYRDYYWTDTNDDPPFTPGGIEGSVLGNRRAASILNTWSYTVSSNDGRAALQLAVWEAIYDNGSSMNLNAGNFYLGSFGASAVETLAGTYYAGSSADGVGIYANDDQNLLRGVPEPGTLILLGAGLLSSGVASWRRRRRS